MGKTYKSFADWQKDFKKQTARIKKEIANAMPEVGEMMETDIKKRTRLGYGVADNKQSKQRLEKLSDSYKKQRKRGKKKGELSSDTSPAKSNLTRTGSMLDSLDTSVNKNKYTVRVEPSGTDKSGMSNKKKAEYVSKLRPFLYLSKTEIKRITEFLKKELDSIVKKLF